MKFAVIALLLASTSGIRLVKDEGKPKEEEKKDVKVDGLVHQEDGTKSFPNGQTVGGVNNHNYPHAYKSALIDPYTG